MSRWGVEWIGGVSLALLLAAPGWAGSTVPAGADAAAPVAPLAASSAAASAAGPLAAFGFLRFTDASFTADRREGLAALIAAHTPAELEAARLQIGTLYLAHLMLPEARSLLEAINPANLPPASRARLGALLAAAQIMQGQPLAADDKTSPLAASNRAWADYPFWSALNAIRAKEGDGIRDYLPAAFRQLQAYPRVYAETCLPLFFAAALDIGDMDLAKKIAVRFDAYPDLKAQPVYKYLLGRAALAVSRPDSAREAFGEAAQGEGPYARRAMIALVDLGLQDKSLPPAKAQILLKDNLARWQGGDIELETLRRLSQVDRTLGDWPDMLMSLGRLLRDFPDSEDAAPATRQADSLIGAYYKFAIEGKVPLGDLLKLHRRMIPLYRFDAAFETASEALADHLLRLGATAMAAQEYGRIYDTLRLGVETKRWPLDPVRLDRLKLGEAEALAAGGRWQDAALALGAVGTPPATLADRKAVLQARIQSALGNPAAAASAQIAAPDPADLRLLAQSAMAAKDWAAARSRYQSLRSADPKGFGDADAINLLLAAWNLDDKATAREVAAAYPDLGGAAHWGKLAGTILAEPAQIAPLKRAEATAQINGAQNVIDQVAKAAADTPAAGAAAKEKPAN